MKASLPVLYEANVVPKGARVARTETFVASVTVELAEAADAEAPVAARGLQLRSQPGVHCPRWHDGGLWIPDGGEEPTDLRDWSEGLLRHGGGSRAWRMMHPSRPDMPAEASRTTDGCRSVLSSGLEDETRRVIEFAAAHLLLVDGVMHCRIETPLAAIMDQGAGPAWRLVDCGMPRLHASGWMDRPSDFFALTRGDDMDEHAREHYFGIHGGMTMPRISLPEAFEADYDDDWSVRAAAGIAVEATEECLPDLEQEAGNAWFRLRDGLRSGEGSEALLDGLTGLAGMLAFAREPSKLRADERVEIVSQLAARAQSRWSMRPVPLLVP